MTTLKIVYDEKYKDILTDLYNSLNQYNTDLGFDLYLPEDITIEPYETKLIDLKIKAEYCDDNHNYGYQIYPRSSIYKTKIRLANSVGIIDPEYRGNLKVAIDNISNVEQFLKKGERYFQLVFVKLEKPDRIEITDKLSESNRGINGFGSTGK